MFVNYKNSIADEHTVVFATLIRCQPVLVDENCLKILEEIRMFLCFADCRVSQNSQTFDTNDLLFCAFSEDLEYYFNCDYGIACLRNRV